MDNVLLRMLPDDDAASSSLSVSSVPWLAISGSSSSSPIRLALGFQLLLCKGTGGASKIPPRDLASRAPASSEHPRSPCMNEEF